MNINSLPDLVMLEIFHHLTQNELCRISRVCKKWNEYTKSIVFWKEVDVNFFLKNRDPNESILFFVENIPFNITQLKLDFNKSFRFGSLNFEKLCMKLNEKCPNLHRLDLHHADFSVALSSVIHLCSKFLPNLKVLILPHSSFDNSDKGSEHDGSSKIDTLDISFYWNIQKTDFQCFCKMPCLKKLSLFYVGDDDNVNDLNWSFFEEDFSFLQRLEFLNLGLPWIGYRAFEVLKIYARNLTELFLCDTNVYDDDFMFHDAFPLLKTICLKGCLATCTGIQSLLESCQSLENVYVNKDLVEAWANHPFNTANILGIVKSIDDCCDHAKLIRS